MFCLGGSSEAIMVDVLFFFLRCSSGFTEVFCFKAIEIHDIDHS